MPEKKNRLSIPSDVAAEILFQSDQTCCVCNERGKSVQIHHIDEDPSNNSPGNLSVLCLQCHDNTQISGGFGRKLNAPLVIKYRNDWIARVKNRRAEADRMAVQKVSQIIAEAQGTAQGRAEARAEGRAEVTAEGKEESKSEATGEGKPESTAEAAFQASFHSEAQTAEIIEYVKTLPARRAALHKIAHLGWDTGRTSDMVSASSDYVAALEAILMKLGEFHPQGKFSGESHRFFSEQISARYAWHWACAEPEGPGTGGTIVRVLVSGAVISDVERMVEDMAYPLVGMNEDFDWLKWKGEWHKELSDKDST